MQDYDSARVRGGNGRDEIVFEADGRIRLLTDGLVDIDALKGPDLAAIH